ncbi:hypothetical protein FKM82_015391 [Ascaphus truei]
MVNRLYVASTKRKQERNYLKKRKKNSAKMTPEVVVTKKGYIAILAKMLSQICLSNSTQSPLTDIGTSDISRKAKYAYTP